MSRFCLFLKLEDPLRDVDARVLLAHKVDVLGGQVLAHDQPTVVALGVVPAEAVPEKVVEEGHAGLLTEAVGLEEAVGLGPALRPAVGPGVELASPKHVGVPHALQGGGPEPAADVVRLEPGRVATVNLLVAEPPAGPNLPHVVALHNAAHKVHLVLAFKADQVHATLPAVVPGGEPVPSGVGQHGLVAVPGEPVGLAAAGLRPKLILPGGTQLGIGQAHLAIAARVHLRAPRVPRTVPGHALAVEAIVLPPVAASVAAPLCGCD